MNIKSKLGLALCIATVLLLISVTLVAAATFQLSGRVTDQSGDPLAGSLIEVIDPGTGSVVASATTDGSGNYSMPVSEGTYNIQVIPPTGSGFGLAIALNKPITNDTNLDFVLVPAGVAVLSGRVLDSLSNGIPGQNVSLTPWNGGPAIGTTTDNFGNYSLSVAPGDYRVEVNRYGNDSSINAPQYYYIYNYPSPLSLNQSTVLDLQLPAKKVSVHVQDPVGNPIANVRLETTGFGTNDLSLGGLTASGYSHGRERYTNATGDAILWLFPTCSGCSYSFTAFPPSGTPFATFTVHDITVITDKSIIIVLQFVHAPPSTTITLNPLPNQAGNYPGNVTVSLSANTTAGNSVANTYYSVDGGSQQTYTTPFVVSGEGSHSIKYWSVDNAGVYETPKYKYFNIASLRIVTEPPLPSGTIGVPYSVLLEADGGTQPYTWSIAGGALPPGLNINPTTGEISGTPTTAGTFGFTVQVEDSSQLVVSKQFNLAPPAPSGNTGSNYVLPISIPDVPPDSTPPSGGGGGLPACSNYRLVSGTLPDGITMDPVTGIISGIPLDGGTYNFTVECVDVTNQTVTKDFTITIYNPLPTITQLVSNQAREDTGDFTLRVIGTNFVQSSVVQWNGSSRATTFVSTTELEAAITNSDIATSGTASVTVVNPEPNGGTSNAVDFTILPNNPPIVDAGGPYSVNEGSSVEVVASGDDPDGDPVTYKWDLNNDGIFETDGSTASFSAANLDGPSSYTIVVKTTDSFGLSTTDQATVVVENVAPAVGTITGPMNPVQINTAINTSVNFTDPGMLDTHTAVWDWGDNATSAGTVTETNGSGSVTGNHAYTSAGVYTVKVTVTDDDGGFDTEVFQYYVVVYDPNGGFVTGGGWINSPLGAYTVDPLLTGKATFGFVSKYQKGSTIPTGNTEFQFHIANMNFKSTSYDWLVVSGAKAQFKGTGTINGTGNYGFLLSAIDGAPDKFRIKIWDKTTDEVVYDNQLGTEDSAGPTTTIQGGSIVVHKAK